MLIAIAIYFFLLSNHSEVHLGSHPPTKIGKKCTIFVFTDLFCSSARRVLVKVCMFSRN